MARTFTAVWDKPIRAPARSVARAPQGKSCDRRAETPEDPPGRTRDDDGAVSFQRDTAGRSRRGHHTSGRGEQHPRSRRAEANSINELISLRLRVFASI